MLKVAIPPSSTVPPISYIGMAKVIMRLPRKPSAHRLIQALSPRKRPANDLALRAGCGGDNGVLAVAQKVTSPQHTYT